MKAIVLLARFGREALHETASAPANRSRGGVFPALRNSEGSCPSPLFPMNYFGERRGVSETAEIFLPRIVLVVAGRAGKAAE